MPICILSPSLLNFNVIFLAILGIQYLCKVKFKQPKVGILGGGQLGRMLLPPANYLNIHISCLDPNPEASCADLANRFVVGDFNDYQTVLEFGQSVDVITIEIEQVNVQALKELAKQGKKVFPQPEVIEIIQDKRNQKAFYVEHDIPTSPFHILDSGKDLEQIDNNFFPAFQKLGKGGYDGGGVQRMNAFSDIKKGFDAPSLIEKAVDFDKEISIIAARNEQGQVELFPTVEMVFHPEHNLVDYLLAPATLAQEVEERAQQIAENVVNAFGFVGLLAIEMFVTKNGEVLVNECAPRPHNSGHQTIQGATVSQFEQHLRAILNLPLAKPSVIQPSAMVNLLGAEEQEGEAVIYGLEKVLAQKGIHIVLYGKKQTRPHRKMGHATVLGESKKELIEKINYIKENFKIGI